MGTTKTIYKNAIYLSIGDVFSKILQFIIMLYAARILSKEHFGQFNFAMSLSFLILIIADMGLNNLFIREVSRKKEMVGEYFTHSLFLKFFLSILAFSFSMGYVFLFDYPPETRLIVLIVCLFTLLTSITSLFYSIFRSFEKMQFDGIVKISRMVLLASASLSILFIRPSIVLFSISFLAVELAIVLISFLIAWRYFLKGKLKLEINTSFLVSLWKETLPFGVGFMFASVYFWSSAVILSTMEGDAAVATFSAPYNLVLGLLFIPNIYMNAIYPVLSRYHIESRAMLSLLYLRSIKYILLIGSPLCIGLFTLSPQIIDMLYGDKYSDSAIVLTILSAFLLFKFVNFLQGTMLTSTNRQKERMWSQGLGALINVLLNFLLIPLYGYVGAAFSLLLTEASMLLLYGSFIYKTSSLLPSIKDLAKLFLACAAMGMVLSLPFNIFLTIPLAGLCYGVFILLLRLFDGTDDKIMQEITGKSLYTYLPFLKTDPELVIFSQRKD